MKAKKVILTVAAMALVAVIAVSVTFAYLTSTAEEVKNTFTIGNVKITLDEAKVDEYGVIVTGDDAGRVNENEYKLVPGHIYTKDPTVHVEKGSEQCYVFIRVVDDITAIEFSGTVGETTYKKVADQIADNHWVALADVPNVYYYQTIIDAREADNNIDLPIFSYFRTTDNAALTDANGNSLYAESTITINAYAIQADGFASAADAWAAAPDDWKPTAQSGSGN